MLAAWRSVADVRRREEGDDTREIQYLSCGKTLELAGLGEIDYGGRRSGVGISQKPVPSRFGAAPGDSEPRR